MNYDNRGQFTYFFTECFQLSHLIRSDPNPIFFFNAGSGTALHACHQLSNLGTLSFLKLNIRCLYDLCRVKLNQFKQLVSTFSLHLLLIKVPPTSMIALSAI
jgi:hypothetical protein